MYFKLENGQIMVWWLFQYVFKFTCRMAVKYSFYNFTLLCRATLPGLTGDILVAITLASFRAALVSEPSVSYLHTDTSHI